LFDSIITHGRYTGCPIIIVQRTLIAYINTLPVDRVSQHERKQSERVFKYIGYLPRKKETVADSKTLKRRTSIYDINHSDVTSFLLVNQREKQNP